MTVSLDDGETIECDRRLLVAAGRTPTVDGLGLERIGVEVGKGGIVVDEYLAAAENVWAIGDVTGISLFTHVAKYQARVAALEHRPAAPAMASTTASAGCASTISRLPRWARSKATSSASALVGDEPDIAVIDVRAAEADGIREALRLILDDASLVGAVAVGPEAGEWLQQGRSPFAPRCPSTSSWNTHPCSPLPTFSEALSFAARDLPL